MYSFKNDYSEGTHPNILRKLLESNDEQLEGYGLDRYCEEAKVHIKRHFKCDKSDIHFLSGGTQTNLIALSSFLRPHEAAISANTGHVLVHETGAIEATGHKVISVEVKDGKLNPTHIQGVLDYHSDEHMVKPKLVYISNPTEIGSIYSYDELKALNECCRMNNLFLFVDGARLGSALTSKENDLKPEHLTTLTDAYYIGATKNGGLLGESLVINNEILKSEFRYLMKQKGALLAKGRLIGIQYTELFKENLYFELASYANELADKLRNGIVKAGYNFLSDSPTNQIFPVLPDKIIERLSEEFNFYVWEKVDDNQSAIRLVTSWATHSDEVEKFIKLLK